MNTRKGVTDRYVTCKAGKVLTFVYTVTIPTTKNILSHVRYEVDGIHT
jgi:hypothetical protein